MSAAPGAGLWQIIIERQALVAGEGKIMSRIVLSLTKYALILL